MQLKERQKTKKKNKVQRFQTRAKNEEIKNGMNDTEEKLVVVPKEFQRIMINLRSFNHHCCCS